MRERENYRELILENIEYDYLIRNHPLDRDRLDELVELMVDTVCSHRETIRIAGDDYPAEGVKSRFLKLDSSHIEYVLDRMRENTTYVRNIKKYLLTALYNAPATIGSYYCLRLLRKKWRLCRMVIPGFQSIRTMISRPTEMCSTMWGRFWEVSFVSTVRACWN